ncbi:MAG: SGNH/GDSL hydrolase family protein [Rhodobacteraceae bacterium]|nr:SGNH/GDSL hydrolase family protein [Paracoccaceae bacterium]
MAQGSAGQGGAGRLLCLIPAVYFLAIAAYALLHPDQFSSGLPRFLRYVAAPGALALVLAAAAFLLPAAARLMTGLTTVSVLAALFLFEAWLTLRYLPAQAAMLDQGGAPGDSSPYQRSLPPAYTFKALNGELGTERLAQAVLEGTPGAPVYLCGRKDGPVIYQAGRFGFRNPAAGSARQQQASLLLLGDSFAEGMCLPDGEDLASRLRLHFPGLVNTGSRGAGPLYELAVLGRYGPVLKPQRTVMAFFAGNDWTNLEREAALPWLAEALEEGARFGPPGRPARQAGVEQVLRGWWQQSGPALLEYASRQKILRNFLALQKTAAVFGLHYPQAAQPMPLYDAVLQRAAEITAQWEGELVVVFIPMVERFHGLLRHDFVHDPLRRAVQAAAAEAGLQVIDLTEGFEASPDPRALYAPDAHFSAAGAELAAQIIAREMGAGTDKAARQGKGNRP